jgi:hypothetical protein|tara:strand:+ start:1298 stop:1471 length:174 start_codon:yes stop_codon:yes gene_type:complete
MKYWNEEKIKSAKYNEVLIQLNDLLKDYYYNSETENMSKDVFISIDNIIQFMKKERL